MQRLTIQSCELNRPSFDVQEVIADRGYGGGPTYSAFRERKIRTYIPLHDARLGQGKLTPTEFKYHSKTDNRAQFVY